MHVLVSQVGQLVAARHFRAPEELLHPCESNLLVLFELRLVLLVHLLRLSDLRSNSCLVGQTAFMRLSICQSQKVVVVVVLAKGL